MYDGYYRSRPTKRRKLTRHFEGYEFVREPSNPREGYRTPRTHPYSFDDYWIWHDDLSKQEKEQWGADYGDRINSWAGYGERYRAVVEEIRKEEREAGKRTLGRFFTREQTQKVIEAVYEGKYDAAGLALSCNLSTGYEILIFYYKPKKAE